MPWTILRSSHLPSLALVLALCFSWNPAKAQEDPCKEFGGIQSPHSRFACCASSCGTCGGMGCAARNGGANACCVHHIAKVGKACGLWGSLSAPCLLLDKPDVSVRVQETKLTLSPVTRSDNHFQLGAQADMRTDAPAVSTVMFEYSSGPDIHPLSWRGIRFQKLQNETDPCQKPFSGPLVLNGTYESLTVRSLSAWDYLFTRQQVLALIDDMSASQEATFCYQLVATKNGKTLTSDPKIYNKRPDEGPKTKWPHCSEEAREASSGLISRGAPYGGASSWRHRDPGGVNASTSSRWK